MSKTYTIKVEKPLGIAKCRVCTRAIYPHEIAVKMKIDDGFQIHNLNCHTTCLIRKIILDIYAMKQSQANKEIAAYEKIVKLLEITKEKPRKTKKKSPEPSVKASGKERD